MNPERDDRAHLHNNAKVVLHERHRGKKYTTKYTWDNVARIIYYTEEEVECPLCWEQMKLPRILSCGHYFCFLCIMKTWEIDDSKRECPMCRAKQDDILSLKRMYIKRVRKLKIGDRITMILIAELAENNARRVAQYLPHYRQKDIPEYGDMAGKINGVVIQRDEETRKQIRSDMDLVKTLRYNTEDSEEITDYLQHEKDYFEWMIKIVDRFEFATRFKTGGTEGQFNLLRHQERPGVKMAFRSCEYHNVKLKEEQQEFLKQFSGEDTPYEITGIVTEVTEQMEVADKYMLQGQTTRRVKIWIEDEKILKTLDGNTAIRRHAKRLMEIEEKEKKKLQEIAEHSRRTRNDEARIITDTRKQGRKYWERRKPITIVVEFNECIYGERCENEKPGGLHDRDCLYFKDAGASLNERGTFVGVLEGREHSDEEHDDGQTQI